MVDSFRRPSRKTLVPKRTTWRSEASAIILPLASTSAASMRMELLPISMAAYWDMTMELSFCNTTLTQAGLPHSL